MSEHSHADGAVRTGLFCGLVGVDVIQLVDAPPGPDDKIVARDQVVAAGGPATNAAVAFAALGGRAVLAAPVGRGPLAELVRTDLATCGVELVDCAAPSGAGRLPVSSCTVTASTGQRAVVSGGGLGEADASALFAWSRAEHGRRTDPDVVLIDGHYPALARTAVGLAEEWGALTLMDAGSWKDFAADLPGACDLVAPSARFFPPGPQGPLTEPDDVMRWLQDRGVAAVVLTRGHETVRWWCGAAPESSSGEVLPPVVNAIDTLGAGDVFHGALAWALAGTRRPGLTGEVVAVAVREASVVAAQSTTVFGTRAWRS